MRAMNNLLELEDQLTVLHNEICDFFDVAQGSLFSQLVPGIDVEKSFTRMWLGFVLYKSESTYYVENEFLELTTGKIEKQFMYFNGGYVRSDRYGVIDKKRLVGYFNNCIEWIKSDK